MSDAIGGLLVFFDPGDLGNSIRNGIFILLAGLSIVGNNQFCSRSENVVFSFCGVGIASYGIAHELAAAYVYLFA